MIIKNPQYMLVIGTFSLVVSLVLYLFGGESSTLAFLQGLFLGVSLVMNLAYLYLYRRGRSVT